MILRAVNFVDSRYLGPGDAPSVARLRAIGRGLSTEVVRGPGAVEAENPEPAATETAAVDSPDETTADEWLQHLVCLGYLGEKQALEGAGKTIADAYDALAADLAGARALLSGELTGELANRAPGAEPGPVALAVVEQALAFDDGLEPPADFIQGHNGFWSRVMHHRLSAMMLYRKSPDMPTSAETEEALRLFDAMIVGGTDIAQLSDRALPTIMRQFARLSGDVETLLRNFIATMDRDPLVFDTGEEPRVDAANSRRLVLRDGRFHENGGLLGGLFGPRPRFGDDPLTRADHGQCRLGKALLQMSLWSLGYYEGRLDGIWGKCSQIALSRFADDHGDQLDSYVRRLDKHLIAVNPVLFVQRAYGTEPMSADRNLDHIDIELSTATVTAPETAPAPPARGLFGRLIRKALDAGRRILSSLGSIAKAFGVALRRSVAALKGAVGPALLAIGGVGAYIFRGAREAVRMIRRAIAPLAHFVLRQPIVTVDETGRALTIIRHDLDRDALLWVAPWATTDQITAATDFLARITRAYGIALTIAVLVLDAITPPFVIGWLRIGLKVAGILRRAVARRKMSTGDAEPILA